MHLTLLGEAGFRRLAELNHAKAATSPTGSPRCRASTPERELLQRIHAQPAQAGRAGGRTLAARRILAGVPVSRLIPDDPSVENLLLLAATETSTEHGMGPLIAGLKEVL